ncbi:MAG: DUF2069 domain-containing protein [Methylococcales bacterium]|nr:DUF2069 domain-containing protein [Methylococcales bacterium]
MNPRYLYYIALTGYFGLFFLMMLWNTLLAPSRYFPVSIVLIVMVTPLLLPLRGLLEAKPKSCAWAAYVSLLYFIHGSIEAFVTADQRLLAILEVIFSLLLFFGASFYVRLRKKTP